MFLVDRAGMIEKKYETEERKGIERRVEEKPVPLVKEIIEDGVDPLPERDREGHALPGLELLRRHDSFKAAATALTQSGKAGLSWPAWSVSLGLPCFPQIRDGISLLKFRPMALDSNDPNVRVSRMAQA